MADELGFDFAPATKVGTLRIADQQKIELMRAVLARPALLVLDEPTAALPPEETDRLWTVVHRLCDEGTAIVLVSHFLRDVLRHADVVTVMRDGAVVSQQQVAQHTEDTLITDMLGRSLESAFPPAPQPRGGAPALELRKVTTAHVTDVNLVLHPGEIVGLAGLLGSGRSEVGRAIFGVDRVRSGSIYLQGRKYAARSVAGAIAHGIAMVPESRRSQGLILARPTGENITLASLRSVSRAGFIRRARERELVASMLSRIGVRESATRARVGELSGGNQQKVLLGKWMARAPEVLVVDEPTRGVDIGSKYAIYELLTRLAAEGVAILFISSDLEETLALANRIVVMRNGCVAGEFGQGASEEAVLSVAFGLV